MNSRIAPAVILLSLVFTSYLGAQRNPLPGELAGAAAAENLRDMDVLLSRGADPDERDGTGQTPLVYAVLSGRSEIVERMLATTADPDRPGRNGLTPLMAAVNTGREDLLVLLLSAGADPGRIGNIPESASPLSIAINRGAFSMARRLFDAGADPGRLKTQDAGSDPLDLPIIDTPVDLRLWQDLADIRDSADSPDWNARSDGRDTWVLHRSARENNWREARTALDEKAEVNAADERGVTALMSAAWHGNPAMVSLLLQRGADPALMDNRGRTALAYAAASGHRRVLETLLDLPAVLEPERRGDLDGLHQSPLYYALITGRPAVLKTLVDAGVSAGVPDEEGITLLMIAAWLGDLQGVRVLLPISDGGQRDRAGRSALAWSAAAFDRDRRAGRDIGDRNAGQENYPVARILAARLRNPAVYQTQPSRDMVFGEFDAAEAWSPGRNPAVADELRTLRPSPVPRTPGDGDLILYRIFRDEEPGIPSAD